MDEQINGEEMVKTIEKLQRMKTKLKNKLDAKIVKMAEYERKMREEMAVMRNEIGEILEEQRILQNQLEEMKAEEKENQQHYEYESSAIPIEKMQQRKRAVEKDDEELSKEVKQSKLTEKGVPKWLIEVLAWIRRIEMANSALSTSSWAFKELCWPKLHGQVKPHFVKDTLGFYYGDDELGNKRGRTILYRFPDGIKAAPEYIANAQIIPIATIPPPDYILGFDQIHLWFLNNQVIQFMENAIKKAENIRLKPTEDVYGWEKERSEMLAMHRLLTVFSGKIFELDFNAPHQQSWADYDYFHYAFPYVFDETQQLFLTADDDERIDFVFNWLTKQRKFGDGKPRLLWLSMDDEEQPAFVERVKQEFVNSTRQNTFLIVADTNLDISEFTIENAQTGEQLCLYRKEDTEDEEHCIARYGKGEEDRKVEMENKMFDNDEHVTDIYLSIKEFGNFV